MGSRAQIAKIDRDGNGLSIYLGHGCYPDDAGVILFEFYSDEKSVDKIIELGDVHNLDRTPDDSIFYHRDHQDPWKFCQPEPLQGGTEYFFSRYWGIGMEWLYAWTPDGWFAARGMKGRPPPCYLDGNESKGAPEWRDWMKKVAKFQRRRPAWRVISDYARYEAARRLTRAGLRSPRSRIV